MRAVAGMVATCLVAAAAISSCGTPQQISSTTTTSRNTLTGYCFGLVRTGAPDQCALVQDAMSCRAGCYKTDVDSRLPAARDPVCGCRTDV